jgi:hypothetical protein
VTFAAVARRFNEAAAAAAAAQASATANAVVLPDDMLEQNMELAGWRTRHTMARASASWAQSAATRLRFDVSAEVRNLAHMRLVTNAQGTHSFMGSTIIHGGGQGNGAGRATDIDHKPDPGSVCYGGGE